MRFRKNRYQGHGPGVCRASYTIEASLLFPFILSVIVLIIYGSFFLHDRAVLDAAAFQAALRGSELTSEHADVLTRVRETGEAALKDRLLATRNVDTDIRIEKNEISVRYTGEFVIPAGVVLTPGFKPGAIRVEAEGHSARLNPTGFVRECRIVENAVGK